MKRLHLHVSVHDLAQSVRFYSTLFAAGPAVTKADYAKWMLDNPSVNFAISTHGGKPGLDHAGIQVGTQEELQEVYARLRQAGRPVSEQGATTCCYAQSEKAWITDPQGLSWEAFLTTGESTVHGDKAGLGPVRTASQGQSCCAGHAQPATDGTAAASACCAAASV